MIPANDPQITSFVEVKSESHFPIQNLPFGICRPLKGEDNTPRVCSRIGDYAVDISVLETAGYFDDASFAGTGVFNEPTLNKFMGLGKTAWRETRNIISELLRMDRPAWHDEPELRDKVLTHLDLVEVQMPVEIGDYTDFYSSEQHARNVGTMFRDPENALMPNWKHLPVGYHGRASSIVASGTALHRPSGQILPENSEAPVYAPCKLLDFELELGFITGPGNSLGNPISTKSAEDHIFGVVLVNDWSARDIQKWEYKPLGPFLAKNWATTISPWVVTLDALEPFRIPGPTQNPEPLPYLKTGQNHHFDIKLEVALKSKQMKTPDVISQSNFRYMYWSMVQQLAHQTVTGCNIRPGDLYASGTISGPTEESCGSMLELAWKGTKPITLSSSEKRTFLQDGDTVILSGYCQGDGYKIGLGEAVGTILPAKPIPEGQTN